MRLRIIKPTTLLAAPTSAATALMWLVAGEVVNSAGDKVDQWIQVQVSGSVSEQEGWIRLDDCEEIPDEWQPEISREYFVHECFTADRWFAKDPIIASSAASAEFLMARAIIETNIRNSGPMMVGSDAVGPFQISSVEWTQCVNESEDDLVSGLDLIDRNKPEFGTYCAAWRMRDDARAITHIRQESGGSRNRPFGPTELDLFQAYVLDNPLAAVAVLDSVESAKNKPVDQLLRGVMSEKQIDDLFAKRGRFLGTANQPRTVGEFVTITSFALNEALQRASELDQAYGPISRMMAKRRAANATVVGGGRAEARSDTAADEFENLVIEGVPPDQIEEAVRGADSRSPLGINRERQLDGSYKMTVRLPKRDFESFIARPKTFPESFDLDGAGSGSGDDNEPPPAPPDPTPPLFPPPPAKGLPAESKADTVDVSVFGPQSLRAGGQCLIQVFLHSPDQAGVSLKAAKETDAAAERRAVKTLSTEIASGAHVTAILEGRGLTVDQEKQDIVWRGNPTSCEFTVSAPTNSVGKTFYPRILLLVNSAPVGSVTIALPATPEEQPVTNDVRGEQARRYSNAFLSYASENRAEVLKRAQGLQAARIDFFQDLLDLKPGERWEKKLYQKIDSCDLFLLFWSTEARNSPWVMKEVEYALNRQKLSPDQLPDITPVIIEGPPPPEPPDSMRDIQFNDSLMYVLAAVQAQPPRSPKPG